MKTNEKINYQANHGTKQETLEKQILSAKEVFASFENLKFLALVVIVAVASASSWVIFKGWAGFGR